MNLYSVFRRRFPADDGKPCMVSADGQSRSYGELEAASARMANLLKARGVEPGDRVAVQAEKSPEAVFLYLACLRAGAVYLPLNTAYQPDELAYFLDDAQPRLVVCRPEDEALIAGLAKEAVNRAYETTLAEGVRFERRLFHSTFAIEDRKEGMTAFTEKRPPVFKNR